MAPEKVEELLRVLEQVRAADCGSRDLDRDVHVAIGNAIPGFKSGVGFSFSLDACLSLLGEVLPGWSWNVGAFSKMRAQLAEPVMTEFGPGIGIRAECSRETTAPLALLDCILQALLSQQDVKETT